MLCIVATRLTLNFQIPASGSWDFATTGRRRGGRNRDLSPGGKTMMGNARGIAAAIVCMAMVASGGAAIAGPISKAEKLRRLDIMLMVTGLRCRAGGDDFQGDFAQFEAHHMAELNRAAQDLSRESAAPGGAPDTGALDRLSTAMANAYGAGHPWLGCHELKGLTHQLAQSDGEEPLIAAADETLSGDGPAVSLLAAR
jgi:hypothetical protein